MIFINKPRFKNEKNNIVNGTVINFGKVNVYISNYLLLYKRKKNYFQYRKKVFSSYYNDSDFVSS